MRLRNQDEERPAHRNDSAPDHDPPGDPLSDEAIEWLVRLNAGGATAADEAAFRRWRAANPAHEDAVREAEAIWADLPRTRHAKQYRAAAYPGESCPATAPNQARTSRRRAVVGLALAASLVLAVFGGNVVGPLSGFLADHATAIGERRTVTLPDGSLAELNSATSLSVEYSDAERRVILHDGEAWFDVAPNPARPFVVAAADGSARAVGTAYAVRRAGGSVDVAVTEGIVAVRKSADGHELRVSRGQAAAWGPGAPLHLREDADTEATTAWRRGKLIFNRRPLGEVVAEIERYRTGRIVIADPDLRALRVTGVFDLADPGGLLRAVEASLGVGVTALPLVTVIY